MSFSKLQLSLIRSAILKLLPAMAAIKLTEFLRDEDYAYWLSIVKQILAKQSAQAKAQLVASFLDGNGRPYRATLAQVETAIASGTVPPTFLPVGTFLKEVNVAAALLEADEFARFNAAFEAAAETSEQASATG